MSSVVEPGTSLEELSLRQQITDAVVVASLDVDSVLDEIEYEREQIGELRNLLLARRDRALGTTNAAALAIGTGLGVISGLLQFSSATSKAGDAVGFAAGGISTLLSLHSFRQLHGGKRPAWVLPNMLVPFFGESQEPHNHYPDDIWAYLKSVPPGAPSQASRRELLVAEWLGAGRFGPPGSPQSRRKMALLTSTNAADKNLRLDVLSERAAMLADVRDSVSLMKRDLRDLIRGLRP